MQGYRQSYSNGRLTDTSVHQYSETNAMHFLLSLLRIKGLYSFRALHVQPQEAPHKRHLEYFVVRVMSFGCIRIGAAPPENEQVMLEIFRGP
jgi:hypothetical protein